MARKVLLRILAGNLKGTREFALIFLILRIFRIFEQRKKQVLPEIHIKNLLKIF